MLQDTVEQYFTESGIPDIFFNALNDHLKTVECGDDYEFEQNIRGIRTTFINALSEHGKINS
jgi:hypothetical protein